MFSLNKNSNLIIRYLILLVIAIPNLYLIYKVFTPLTIYPVFYILSIFYSHTALSGNIISISGISIEIISACIAGAAYYLLLILNLTTPMPLKKRIKSMSFILGTFLILNIFRIILFSVLFLTGYKFFDLAHTGTWYFGSTILLIIIWFVNIKLFKIKNIPIYTDFKYLHSQTLKSKKNKFNKNKK